MAALSLRESSRLVRSAPGAPGTRAPTRSGTLETVGLRYGSQSAGLVTHDLAVEQVHGMPGVLRVAASPFVESRFPVGSSASRM